MADDFYGYDDETTEPKGKDNLFLWTVFILLLIGLAFVCWLGSFYIFVHPENPKAYKFLQKLKKIEAPQRFEVTAAPPGEFLTAQKLFDRYSKMTRLELENENGDLIRNYIKNYRETKKLVTYVTGRYVILDSYDLKKTDVFQSGVVALAQAADFPQVLIEHIYTSSPRNVPALRSMLQTGLDVKLERTNDLSAVVHVEKIPDGRMQLTVVPLLYGVYAVSQGAGTFGLEPPPELNMDPGFPVVRGQVYQEGLKKFATFRHDHPLPTADAAGTAPPAAPELVRVDTVAPGGSVPETGPMPQVPVATPVAIPGKATPRPVVVVATTPKPPIVAASTPRINVAMLTTPTPRPVAAITPLPATATPLPHVAPSGVPLQPFISAKPDPNAGSNGAGWRTYSAGQAPPAKAVSLDEVGAMAERGGVSERTYLRGDFRVTASGTNRAVLRDANKSDDQSPRVVVEYPPGAIPPAERARFTRDTERPYLISDVRRGADGVVTIYVREIINQ